MSTNIHFVAQRKITFKKKDGNRGSEIQQAYFDQWQTPTTVTHEMMKSADTIHAYKDWILTKYNEDEELPVYAEDDYLQENEPVGVKIYNEGKEHVARFEQWINHMEDQGYIITVEAW